MPSNRTLRNRQRKAPITEEMVELYRRGRELKKQGLAHEARHAEFVQIAKRLDWTLLRRHPHEVSVFHDLRGPMPDYMAARCTTAYPDFNGWQSGQELQRRLKAALAARQAS